MKKEYIKPSTEVIRIETSKILCFSGDELEDLIPIPDFGGPLA